ncbi:hypothetical protein ACFWY9_10370 [Amycolatopsis sp. NPDC059027]|uniref:hypothetical protein n=1 Tax=Amycolatopsis sp. NPDC059027 TaxID=3346709 RepID=UPI00366F4D9C
MTQPARPDGGATPAAKLDTEFQGWLANEQLRIRDQQGQGDVGKGFSLDRGEAERMLKQAQQLLVEMQPALADANALAQIQPPARDPASMKYHGDLTRQDSGQPAALSFGAGHVRVQIAYLSELVTRLETALGKTHQADLRADGDIRKAGQTDGGRAG